MEEFLNTKFLGNTVQSYLLFCGTIFVGGVILGFFKAVVFSRIKDLAARTQTDFDDFLLARFEKDATPILYIGFVYVALHHLKIGETFEKYLYGGMVVGASFFAIRFLAAFASMALEKRWIAERDTEFQRKNVKGLISIIRFGIWVLGGMLLLDNLGVEISAIITGLGIGGIAVALAAQAVLGDLFSYVAIFFDKPFEVGDFIVVDQFKGEVEYIGLKTTRLRSLDGEQIIISNSNLTSSRVRNFKRMERRRVQFNLGVTYDTSKENLLAIPEIIRRAIETQPKTAFDRAHFARFADSALQFEAVFMVLDSDYKVFMDIQQAINLTLYDEFQKRGIAFAFPTQTVIMQRAGDL